MKLLSSLSVQKKNKDDNALKSDQFVDVEGFNDSTVPSKGDEPTVDAPLKPWKDLTTRQKLAKVYERFLEVIVTFILVACFISLFCMPPSVQTPNPNPVRHVCLNKTGAGYGVELSANRIIKIISGGSAYLDGRLQINDDIVLVNGIDTSFATVCSQYVIDLMSIRDNDVRLAVTAKAPEALLFLRLLEVLKLSILPTFAVYFFACIYFDGHAQYETLSPLHTVTLNKRNGRYGMCIAGTGTISKVHPGEAAEAQGEIKEGDRIFRINGVRISGMSHYTIIELLDTRPNDVTLEVRSRLDI